uniref:Uncharacterized protein n=1 Tax=Lepeophtheirus salmonis TaxID=72036 RepID=A0A0K2UUL0_LEPSM
MFIKSCSNNISTKIIKYYFWDI